MLYYNSSKTYVLVSLGAELVAFDRKGYALRYLHLQDFISSQPHDQYRQQLFRPFKKQKQPSRFMHSCVVQKA